MNLTDSILLTLAKINMYEEITPLNAKTNDFDVTNDAISFVHLAKEYIYLFSSDNERAIQAQKDAQNCIRIIESNKFYRVMDIWQLHSEISCMLMNKYQKTLFEL